MNMTKKNRRKMPRTREEFDRAIEEAFIAGCDFAAGVDHGINLYEQYKLGASWWLGLITLEEMHEQWEKFLEEES